MKKDLLRIVLLFISFPVLVNAQVDSVFLYKEAVKAENKLSVTKLRLIDVVSRSKKVPLNVRDFKNLEELSLRPLAMAFGRPIGGGPCMIRYANSKINRLPGWLNEFPNLRTLDLIGVNDIDFILEMKKLLKLGSLKILWIDPDTCEDELLDILIQFRHLETLKIRADLTDAQFGRLTKELPNTKITTGIFADY
jgi:hypothetical protein